MSVGRWSRCLASFVLLALLGPVACTSGGADDTSAARSVAWTEVAWTEVALPPPPGTPEADLSLGDVIACADGFLVAGASTDPTGRHPAAWRTDAGMRLVPLRTAPVSIYGRKSELYDAACRPGAASQQVGALGQAVGGAHGNPRTATWAELDGVLTEAQAPFELYGGPRAIAVSALSGGPRGWLAVGSRTAGNERPGGSGVELRGWHGVRAGGR